MHCGGTGVGLTPLYIGVQMHPFRPAVVDEPDLIDDHAHNESQAAETSANVISYP